MGYHQTTAELQTSRGKMTIIAHGHIMLPNQLQEKSAEKLTRQIPGGLLPGKMHLVNLRSLKA